MAIIKQLQFHVACSFEIEEEKGGGKSSVKKSKCANIDVPFFIYINAVLSSWGFIPPV